MRIAIAATTAATLLLAGCGSDAPVKRKPGSWSQKMEVIEFTGPGITPAQKAQMQQMMQMVSKMTVCLTPETVAREDIEKNLTNLSGAAGNCVVADKKIGGGKVSFTANCNEPGKDGAATGKPVRMTVAGTHNATEQNFRVTVESTGASSDGGKLVMNVSGRREGECKPGELTPPPPPVPPSPTPKAAS